jgi:hypothetical protein
VSNLEDRIWKRALELKLEGADVEIEEPDEEDDDLEAVPIPEVKAPKKPPKKAKK